MAEQICVSLPDETKAALDEFVRRTGASTEDVCRGLLEAMLFSDRFHRLRDALTPRAESRGVLTDEDVFEQVS